MTPRGCTRPAVHRAPAAAVGDRVLDVGQRFAVAGEPSLELGGGVALARDEGLAVPVGQQGRVGVEHVDGDLAFVDLGIRQGVGDRQSRGGGDQVQPQSPEEAGVAGAAAVAGPAGQVGALGGGPEPAALDRRRTRTAESVGVQSVSAGSLDAALSSIALGRGTRWSTPRQVGGEPSVGWWVVVHHQP